MKDERKLKMLAILFFLFIYIGGCIVIYFIGKITGEFDFGSVILPVTVGMISGFLITYLFNKWKRKRNGPIPEVDERTIKLMKNYFLYVLYIVLVGSGLILFILFAMGVQTIAIEMLFIYLTILYVLIGLGAIVTKRM